MERHICLHGHFYQPPRENPWLEEVELEDSAAPYHDWNEKITAECYAPNASSRVLDADKRIIDIVNNYAKISFNFGPTLFSWMEQKQPEVYRKILQADQQSQTLFSGHGSAMAQVYNHMILPLANSRDKHTQVIWGIKDFEFRFNRKPEGMWLSETAVDMETLEVLAGQGLKFTVLATRQARRVRKIGKQQWHDVQGGRIDPRRSYLCRLPSGKNIAIFFYDGFISQEAAFGGMLSNGENFARRLASSFAADRHEPQLVNIAMDGETYGHHHRLADMTLAYCLYYLEARNLAKLTVYGEHLEKHPPTQEVEIFENSSWSCIHGIERWKTECGCNSGTHPGWNQSWRAPLRGAMDWLRDMLAHVYEEEGCRYLKDPWLARDGYIAVVLNRSGENVERFLAQHAMRELSPEDKSKVLKLLEMQRSAMLMYTSCGWFFDEISGIETVQVMRYAAHAMQLAQETSQISLEDSYVKLLERAPSNIPAFETGAQVYITLVKPAVVDLLRVGAHFAVSSLFENYQGQEPVKIYSYTVATELYEKLESGRQKFAVGKANIHSDITREEATISFAVLHFGDHNLNGGVRIFRGDEAFTTMLQEVKDAFQKNDIPNIIRLMDGHFGMHNYSLWHLFRDEQRKVLNLTLANTLHGIEASFRQIYEQYYPIMRVVNEMRIPMPKSLATTVELVFNADLRRLLEAENIDLSRLQKLIAELEGRSLELDRETLEFMGSKKIDTLMEKLAQNPEDIEVLNVLNALLATFRSLNLRLNLWKAQNIYFAIGLQARAKIQESSHASEQKILNWLGRFQSLGNYLQVRSM